MKKTRKIISLLLSVLMIITSVPLMAVNSFAATNGTTGDCTWTLDGTVLTISGNGKMEDYNGKKASPWGTSITKVVIKGGVTSIGEEAFRYCALLTSVTIPDSVTSIKDGAFGNCTSLTSVTIPDSVTSIGVGAFSGCSSLKSIIIPDSVTSIGEAAFSACSSLTSVTIPDSVTKIEWCVFGSCTSLTSITIPDSVTSIGAYAFVGSAYYNNESNWENGLLYIGNHLIKADSSNISRNVEIRQGTKTVADSAFERCTSLTSVTIPDSVTSIGDFAFYHCTSLTSITIPDSVTSIGVEALGYYTSNNVVGKKINGFTIYGFFGTEAERYAKESDINFEDLRDPEALTISKAPAKTTYFVGDTLDTTGLELTLTYDNGDIGTVVSGFSIGGFDSSTAGTKVVTVNYKGKTATFNVEVVKPRITIANNSLSFDSIGSTKSLTVTTTPIDQKIAWSSSNKNVATVSDGVVTANGVGNATITATITVNEIEYSAECAVSVVLLDSIAVTKMPIKTEYFIGDTLDTTGLEITAKYTDNTEKVITSDLSITSFDSSVAGKNTITVAYDGKTATFDVEIKAPSIALSESSLAFDRAGATKTLTATAVPNNSEIVWKSSNESVATVENGIVTAKGAGTATITATITVNEIEYSAECAVDVNLPTMSFPDVRSGDWYYDAVKFNFERGYITGYSNGTFGPANNIQRQDFALILARIADADLSAYEGQNGGFSDVPSNAYYSAAVAWAKDRGIVTGYSADHFGVGTYISREQICLIFSRYLGGEATGDVDAIIQAYHDGGNTSPWAKAGVAWAIENGIVGNAGYINPIGNAGRAEVAQIIYNMSNKGMI